MPQGTFDPYGDTLDSTGEPQWDGHDALEFVASIEETLR